jgi:tetrathionate reductase subunit B
MGKTNELSRRDLLKTAGVAVGATATSLLPAIEAAAAKGTVPRWAMVMDLRRCIGCRACTVACKAEYDVHLGTWKTAVSEEVVGKFPDTKKLFIPRRCNHCEGNKDDKVPPCVKECPETNKVRQKFITPEGKTIRYRNGATYKRPDGLILYDNSFCTGCGKCIEACPYGARTFNKKLISGQDSTKNGISKCTSCQHRIDKGVVPACTNICPGRARIFGDINDPTSEVSKLSKEFKLEENAKKTTLLPGENTMPMVFYIDKKGALDTKSAMKKYEKNDAFRDHIT